MIASLVLVAGCAPRSEGHPLDEAADAYVRLALAVGRHDEHFIDAFYGPDALREEANAGDPRPLAGLLDEARALLAVVRGAAEDSRRGFLEKQLVAVEAFLRAKTGESFTLAQEAHLFYDIDVPEVPLETFGKALSRVEALVPGDGPLVERVQALRRRFRISSDRLPAVVEAALAESRRRTAGHVELPEGESFRFEFVTGKPWSGYNWYQGGLASVIQLNTDLPSELSSVLTTMSHESYPGHHTYNALLEQKLVRGRGWREYTVYVLYSPQSLIAEGTANAGVGVIFDPAERLAFLRDVLCPAAGLPTAELERYLQLLETLDTLKYARGEAAKMLLDEGLPEAQVIEFLERYAMMARERAEKSLQFIRTYRAYVFNYTVGQEMVEAYIGDGPDRAARFFGLLERPVTPTELR